MDTPLHTVVETAAYARWADKTLSAEERDEAVRMIAADPESGAVLAGTGGIRKLRLAIGSRGKSGGARIVYYFYNRTLPAFLLAGFAKNEKANLTKAERNALATLADRLRQTYGGP